MKITITAKNLIEGLKRVLNIVSARSPLPILNNVLLVAKEDSVSFMTSDMSITIKTTLPAQVEREGATTLPARNFSLIVSTLPVGDVVIDTDPTMSTTISCGQAHFKIMGTDPSDFPEQVTIDEDQKAVFNKIEFSKNLKKIGYSVSIDRSRPTLNGILLSINEGSVTTVATDGRRLALVEKTVDDQDLPENEEMVIPTKVVLELQKLLEGEGDIIISKSESQIGFVIDETIITSKLIEGIYPNYRQVIPGAFKNSVKIPRESFTEVLYRVAVVINDDGASVKFKLEGNSLTLSASSTDGGEADEPLQVTYEGEPVTFAFNPTYLKDPLKNLECDELIMRFNDEFKPIVILGDEGFLYVIMPMRN